MLITQDSNVNTGCQKDGKPHTPPSLLDCTLVRIRKLIKLTKNGILAEQYFYSVMPTSLTNKFRQHKVLAMNSAMCGSSRSVIALDPFNKQHQNRVVVGDANLTKFTSCLLADQVNRNTKTQIWTKRSEKSDKHEIYKYTWAGACFKF